MINGSTFTLALMNLESIRYEVYYSINASEKPEAISELKTILQDLKEKNKITAQDADFLEPLILDDLFAWGPLTHIFEDPKLELVQIFDFYSINYRLIDGDFFFPIPHSLPPRTLRRMISDIEKLLGYELTAENPIGITKLNDDILIEAAYRGEYSKVIRLRRNIPRDNQAELDSLRTQTSFRSILKPQQFATLNPSNALQEQIKVLEPRLEEQLKNETFNPNESPSLFMDRILKQHFSKDVIANPQLIEFLKNTLLGLGSLEWILIQPDFLSLTVNGTAPITYRLQSSSGQWVEHTYPISFRNIQIVRDMIERVVCNFGLRVDEQCPIVSVVSVDGYKIETGVEPAMKGIFMKISLNR